MDLMSLLGREGLLPHGYCFTWRPEILWTMVSADLVIALAYFSIPLAILSFTRRRPDAANTKVAWLFSAFIFACGITHLMDVWVIWQPDYALHALAKAFTAAVSLITAVALWPLIPRALKIPSVAQLQSVIGSLEAEVAQRRSAEESLSDTQEALVITLASIGAGFMATDRQGHITRMNAVAEQLTGWDQHEALGLPLWQVVARADHLPGPTDRNPVDMLIDSDTTIDRIHRLTLLSRTGQAAQVEVQAALTRTPSGQVRGLAMVLRDMTRIEEAELEAERLAAIVASSQDAIIGKTLDGRITTWNQGAQALFGYSAAEAIGQPVLMLIPPELVHEEMLILSRLHAGIAVPPFETQRRHRDGHLIDLSVNISPIRNARGEVVGASKIARDISQQKQADELRRTGQRLEAENRQIQEASRLKSEFLANMSHELRTPLNAIIGFADLLHAGAVPTSSPKHQEFLGHIGTSGRHLLQLINDVLDLSKVEAGKLEFFPEPIDLRQVVREVSEIIHATALRQGIKVGVEIDHAVAHLTLDPARLKQVLYNYISNAIKFTPAGGTVTVRAMPEGDSHVRIEVEDTGIGIAEADLPRLFVEFQQLDSSYNKRHQGTGLGLALTRRLVQAQGGSVGARSTVGVGSVFHLVLRREHVANGPQAHRLLLIHHRAEALEAMNQSLTQAGFAVDTASTGAHALAQASGHRYDAITLALNLPDQPGLSVLAEIRDDGPSQKSPVIAMTVAATAYDSASLSITDVLSKPVDTAQIGSALKKLGLTNQPGARVMVVDDDPMALAVMATTLQTWGANPILVGSGADALREIELHRPDALILDLMMPVMDGFAVLDALRSREAWRELPVFIWTSMLLTDEEYAHLAQSARAILSKGGGDLQALLHALRRWRPAQAPGHLATGSGQTSPQEATPGASSAP